MRYINYTKILFFTKQLSRISKKVTKRIVNRIWPPTYNLVLLFSNRTKFWTAIGKELYENEPAFRNSIQQCDQITQKISNISILPNFEAEPDEKFFTTEEVIGFTISAVQIALFDLYQSKNIEPNCVSGISLGEFAAVYAIGGINKEEALKLTYCGSRLTEVEQRDYASLFVFADVARINALCEDCKLWVAPLIHYTSDAAILYCHKDDVKDVTDFFTEHQVNCKTRDGELYWPFHTNLMEAHKLLIKRCVENFEPKPIRCDYYSATYGRIITKNSIIPASYWYDMFRKPILFHKLVNELKTVKNLVLLTVGPHFFLKGQVQYLLNDDLVYLDSMNHNTSSLKTFRSVYKSLKALRLDKRKISISAFAKKSDIYISERNINEQEMLSTIDTNTNSQ